MTNHKSSIVTLKSKIKNRKSVVINLTVWLVIFVVLLFWRAQNLDAFSTFNDEGAYLMWSRLPVDGYPLYSVTRAVQPPLFFEWVGLAFRLAGISVQVGRWAMLMGYGLFAAALGWLAYRYKRWPAALTAVILTGIAPLIFTLSRLVMAELLATGLAAAAVGFAGVFLEQKRRHWLVVSGLLFGLSLMTKTLNPFVALPICILLLMARPIKRQLLALLVDGLFWGIAALLPVITVWLMYDAPAMYEQTIAFRGALRAAIPGSWADTWQHFYHFGQTHWGFLLMALGGAVSAVRHRQNQPLTVIWLVWLLSGAAMLLWHSPLFYHHLVILLPPLILLGAGFVANGVDLIRRAGLSGQTAVYGLVIVAAALNLPAIIAANQAEVSVTTGGREQDALKLLRAVSAPADFVMGDSQQLIFMANRRTPPPLGDVALVAIKAGLQTSEQMIELNQQYHSPAVVQWSLRLPWLPDYLAWVEQNYLARRVWDNDHIIYFAPRLSAGAPIPHQQQTRLGDRLTLRGYQTELNRDSLVVKTYWQPDSPLPRDYTVFTQLLDSSGALVAGWDSQPLGGYFPTTAWPAGEIVTDIVQFPLPPNLSPGDYTLITGMYLLETLERLPAADGGGFVTLTTIALP
jgi:hypothetical protein